MSSIPDSSGIASNDYQRGMLVGVDVTCEMMERLGISRHILDELRRAAITAVLETQMLINEDGAVKEGHA